MPKITVQNDGKCVCAPPKTVVVEDEGGEVAVGFPWLCIVNGLIILTVAILCFYHPDGWDPAEAEPEAPDVGWRPFKEEDKAEPEPDELPVDNNDCIGGYWPFFKKHWEDTPEVKPEIFPNSAIIGWRPTEAEGGAAPGGGAGPSGGAAPAE